MKGNSWPCLRVLDAGADVPGRECLQPSTYQATGNEALWDYVCGDCWQALPEAERELYAFVGLDEEAEASS